MFDRLTFLQRGRGIVIDILNAEAKAKAGKTKKKQAEIAEPSVILFNYFIRLRKYLRKCML